MRDDKRIAEFVRNGGLDPVLGGGEKSVSFLAAGEYNRNYKVTANADYVLRLNTGSQIPVENQIAYEYESLRVLEESGVTPRVFAMDRSRVEWPFDWLLMEFLPGKPLQYEKDAITAMRLLSTIHALPVLADSHFLIEADLMGARLAEGERLMEPVWDSPHVEIGAKRVFDRARERLHRGLSDHPIFTENPSLCINNTELNSHNFLIGKNDSYVIDWEKPVLSDAVQDLVHFWSPTSTLWKTKSVFSEREKRELLFQYEKNARPDPDRADKIRIYTPYLYWRAFTWCAFALTEYRKPDRPIRNEDTLRTIQQYLEPDFMNAVWENRM